MSYIPRPEVRMALLERLPTGADFEAFCLDYFPKVYALFTSGMNRLERTNLLLESVGYQRVWEQLHGGSSPFIAVPLQNPYRGLSAFEIEDAGLFYGRGELIVELRQRVRDLLLRKPPFRLLPLLGATGCGKSSLLRAGLLASLMQPSEDGLVQLGRERIVLFMPGDRPLHSLTVALKKCAGDALSFDEIHDLLRQPEGLSRIYERLAKVAGERERPLIVAVDQLEELYALAKSPTSADTLIARLMEAVHGALPIVVIVTLRTDFLYALAQHPELNQAVNRDGRLVPVLDSTQLAAAIATPAQQAGCPLPPPLIAELLEQAAGQKNSLPLIQFALQRLWPSIVAGQDGLEVLSRLGGIGGALAGWADSLYAALEDDAERRRARRLFLGLVSPAAADRPVTRRLRRVAELVPVRQSESATRRLLYHFSRAHHDHQHGRLLSVSSEDEVMLAHETLVIRWNQLAAWLEEEGEQSLFLERLDASITHWKKEHQAPGLLWRDPDLRKLRELRRGEEPILNRPQEAFLIASEEAERRELAERAMLSEQRRRMAGLLSIAVVGLFGCLVALLFWFRLERQAKNLARSSSASALVTQPGREIQALLLAMQAASESTALGPLWEGLYQVSMVLVKSQLLPPPAFTRGESVPAASEVQTLSVAFSPNNRELLGGRSDGAVVLWNLQSGQPPRRLFAHQGAVNFAGYARQGELILTAGEDGVAQIWDVQAGHPLLTLYELGALSMIDLSPDGRFVMTAGKDGTVRIFPITGGAPLHTLRHEGVVGSARYSPAGDRIVTASQDQLIRIFHATSGVLLRAIGPSVGSSAIDSTDALIKQADGHRGQVRDAVFSHDGQRLFTAGEDNVAIVWDVDTGRQLYNLSGHAAAVVSIEESADGRQLLTASEDNTARLWDARNGKFLLSLSGHTNQLFGAAYSADGERVATASLDGTTRLWWPQERPHRRIEAHNDWVRSAVFSPHEDRILTASADGTASVWDRQSGQRLLELVGHHQWVNSAVYSPDGRLIVTAGMDHTARVFDAQSAQLLATLLGHSDWIRYATFSPDGQLIATAGKDHMARIFAKHGNDWQPLLTLTGHGGAVTSALFSKDGSELLTASEDHTARRWNVKTGEEIGRLSQHGDWVRHAAYSQSGTRILTASRDRTALIWDVTPPSATALFGAANTSRPVLTLKGHTGWVRHAVYSADDRRILTAGGDMTARLWDAQTGAQVLVLTGHSGPVSTAEFSHDGRYAVTAGRDGLVLIHAIDSDMLWRFGCELLRALRDHPDAPPDELTPLLAHCPLPAATAP